MCWLDECRRENHSRTFVDEYSKSLSSRKFNFFSPYNPPPSAMPSRQRARKLNTSTQRNNHEAIEHSSLDLSTSLKPDPGSHRFCNYIVTAELKQKNIHCNNPATHTHSNFLSCSSLFRQPFSCGCQACLI